MFERTEISKPLAKHSLIFAPNQDISDLPKNILPRRANHRPTFIIAELEPAPGNRPRDFCIGRLAHSRPSPDLPVTFSPCPRRNFRLLCPRWAQGHRDEKIAGCCFDRRVVFFVRSSRPGACRKRCFGGSVGSGGAGTDRCGGRCVHRICGGTFDRAFLGNSAVSLALPGRLAFPGGFAARRSTCHTIRRRSERA